MSNQMSEDTNLRARGTEVDPIGEDFGKGSYLSGKDEDIQLTHRKLQDPNALEIEQEFSCPVCLRLVVLPTTLTCGHTSCRVCLAQWFFNSKKKECPMCRLTYHGHPQVNTQIRNLLQTLSPEKALERQTELDEDEATQAILKQYDEELSRHSTRFTEQVSDVTSFCSGIIVAISLFIVAYLAWYWQSADSNLLVKKPVQQWKPRDVVHWLGEMGWAAQYANRVEEQQIDGMMLLSFDEKGLQKNLNITDETHDRALMYAISILRENGLKLPATLWEFKAIYPGRALFLAYGLKNFPRTTILYLFLYFYEELFLPFLQATTGEEGPQQYSHAMLAEPSVGQWVELILCTLAVPGWLVAKVAIYMFRYHFFTPLFVLAMSLLYTLTELINCVKYFSAPDWRALWSLIKDYFSRLILSFGFMVLWPIIPSLVCDIFFYGALYVGPIHACIGLHEMISQHFTRDGVPIQ